VKARPWTARPNLLFVLIVLFSYAWIFPMGFIMEDFLWLLWAEKAGWRDVFAPRPDQYFRPLATALPYFFFSRFTAGFVLWKLLKLFLLGSTAYVYRLWLRKVGANERAATLLALLWLWLPYQAFGTLYFNAFDYLLFHSLAVFYLYALALNRPLPQTLVFLLALLTKEQAVVWPAVALFLLQERKNSRMAVALGLQAVLAGAYLLWRMAGITGLHTPLGFSVSLAPGNAAENIFGYLVAALGPRTQQTALPPACGYLLWSLAVLAWLGLALVAKYNRKKIKAPAIAADLRWRLPLAWLVFQSPLLVLSGHRPEPAALSVWLFLLPLAAAPFGEQLRPLRHMVSLAIGIAFVQLLYVELQLLDISRMFRGVMGEAEFETRNCPEVALVMMENAVQVIPDRRNREYIAHALNWKIRRASFFLPPVNEGEEGLLWAQRRYFYYAEHAKPTPLSLRLVKEADDRYVEIVDPKGFCRSPLPEADPL
jgi:hypothetical protein